MFLRQSTAVDVLIGPFVDLTDGATAETGETPSVKLSKNGQTMAAKNDATTPVHDADGYYNCELDATDTNTVGQLVLTVAASANALPVKETFQVVEEAVYDDFYAAGAAGLTSSAPSVVDSGSQTATLSEDTLSTITTAGTYQLAVDTANMAAGDVLVLRVYGKARTSDTERVMYTSTFTYEDSQDTPLLVSFVSVSPHHAKVTLEQTAGTARAFPWGVYQL